MRLHCRTLVRLILPLVFLLSPSHGGKLLVLHPMFAPSHVHALRPMLEEMAGKGHQVTVVRVDRSIPISTSPNITEVLLDIDNEDGSLPLFTHEKNATFQMPEHTWSQGMKFNFVPFEGILAVAGYCRELLGNHDFVAFLKRQQFDMVLVDLIYNECGLALAHNMGLPAVGYWAFTFVGYEPLYTTGSNLPSTTPHTFSHVASPMTFMDRVWNYFLHIYNIIQMEVLFLVMNHQITNYLPDSPHPRDLLANLSGAIINSHPALDFPRNLPPTFMEVGGFHITEPKKVPYDLAQFMENAGPEGVVLFSMGCTFNTKTIPEEVVATYLRAFARLPQKVLMRVEGAVPFTPKNVKIVSWLPQNDLLAHPSTRLFVTHCGMHGVMEALHHGVPMVGIPVFGDQMDVMLRLQEKNAIIGVDKNTDEKTLVSAMVEAMSNKMYKDNVEYLGKIMRHYNPRPRDSAIWLLEHVMLTQSADHLKIRNRFLNRFQYLSLDVITFILLATIIALFISHKIIKKLDWYISPLRK